VEFGGVASITSNSIVAPNGTTTADSLIASNGVNGASGVYVPETTIGVKTISCYVKKGSKRWASIIGYNGNSNCWYDLDNGVVGTRGANYSTSSITSVGNGWYRIDAVMAVAIGSDVNIGVYATDNDNALTCTGDGTTVSSYIWGAQLNIGSTAKPYFPTTDRLNVPRLTYQNGGGGCPSLLLEKQSTNELSYSEQFDNADWTVKDNLSVTANATTSPDGTQNADKLVEDSSNSSHRVYRSIDGTSKMFSFFAKPSGRSWVLVLCNNGNTWFDIGNGQLGTVASTSTATIENVGNGWYRCAVYNTHASFGALIGLTTGNNVTSYQGDGTSGVFVWGAQLEASSYPTSYIPTTSSSATRVSDACSKTGISSLIGQTSGSVFFDFTVDSVTQPSDPVLWYMKDGGSGERYVELYSNSNLVYAEIDGGGLIATITKSGLTVGRHKCAIAYATNDFVFYVDGVQIGTDTSGTPNGFSTFGLQYYLSTYTGSQKVNQCAIFKTRLTNAELASLTTI
jgi:hypothetical protein